MKRQQRPACPRCKASNTKKNGFIKDKQRWKCRGCSYEYTRLIPRGKPQVMKTLAILLALTGISYRAIGHLLGVSDNSVNNWVQAHARQLGCMPKRISDANQIEIDDLWHSLEKKRQRWFLLAVDHNSSRVLDWQIGQRNNRTLWHLIKRVEGVTVHEIYYTDGENNYKETVSKDELIRSRACTYRLEILNSNIQHWLGRFYRKSKIISHSQKALKSLMTLFIHYRVNFSLEPLLAQFQAVFP